MKNTLFALVICTTISGCGITIKGDAYKNITPAFDPYAFFDGSVKAWGIVQNRSGELVQRFTVEIDGSIDAGSVLTLDETFSYGLGEGVTSRIWTITETDKNQYQGTASDILNKAKGTVYGNAMQWSYDMQLPVDDTTYKVHFDDWMWAFDENTIVNRSYIRKFGVTMAEVTIFMQKQNKR